MDIGHVIILSVIEGVTEFLPVSSTAHLILTSHILSIPKSPFLTTFEISIQLGAIGAVTVLYFRKILDNKKLFLKSCVGFLPTGILGLLFLKQIKFFLGSPVVPTITLFLGGVAMIGIELLLRKHKNSSKFGSKSLDSLKYKDALLIGLIQSISMIPGVSRSAASIYGGIALKLDRKSATEFSFLLAIPTVFVATGYELLKDSSGFSGSNLMLVLVGIFASFISSLFVIRWLLDYLKKNDFIWFGIYRIVLSVLYFVFFLK